MMEVAAKRFFASPSFAVVGASQDKSKFGYKSKTTTTTAPIPLLPYHFSHTSSLTLTQRSLRMVPRAHSPRNTYQPLSTVHLCPVEDLQHRTLPIFHVGSSVDSTFFPHSSARHAQGAGRGEGCGDQVGVAAAGQLRGQGSAVGDGEL